MAFLPKVERKVKMFLILMLYIVVSLVFLSVYAYLVQAYVDGQYVKLVFYIWAALLVNVVLKSDEIHEYIVEFLDVPGG